MSNFRIGHGYDVHKLEEGKKFIIGGIEIDHEKGAVGHSDADVVIHVICDAFLVLNTLNSSASFIQIGRAHV